MDVLGSTIDTNPVEIAQIGFLTGVYVGIFYLARNWEFDKRFEERVLLIRPSDLKKSIYTDVIGDILPFKRVAAFRLYYAITSVLMVIVLSSCSLSTVCQALVDEVFPNIVVKGLFLVRKTPGLQPFLWHSVLFAFLLHAFPALRRFISKSQPAEPSQGEVIPEKDKIIRILSKVFYLQREILDGFISSLLRYHGEVIEDEKSADISIVESNGDGLGIIVSRMARTILRSSKVNVSEIRQDFDEAFRKHPKGEGSIGDDIRAEQKHSIETDEPTEAAMLIRLMKKYGLPNVLGKHKAHRQGKRFEGLNYLFAVVVAQPSSNSSSDVRQYSNAVTQNIGISYHRNEADDVRPTTDFLLKITGVHQHDGEWLRNASSGSIVKCDEKDVRPPVSFTVKRVELVKEQNGSDVLYLAGLVLTDFQQQFHELTGFKQ